MAEDALFLTGPEKSALQSLNMIITIFSVPAENALYSCVLPCKSTQLEGILTN